MSGLAAQFLRGGRSADTGVVDAMLAAVPYRGPDGFAARIDGSVCLGIAKMAVTREDLIERQPLVRAQSGCTIIADARLDNREDLLRQLPERTTGLIGDAEIILRAYEAWGLDAVPRLLGDFAWIIWDHRRQTLVCARDTGGQRSLFYRVDSNQIVAASEIHQLFQDPAVSIVPNDDRIRDFLVPLNMYRNEKDGAATFFAGIQAIPAGHVLVVDGGSLDVKPYWKPPAGVEIRYRTEDEYAEHFRALFFEIVRTRLRTAFPTGVMLSGGLDSASIAGTAQELYRAGEAENNGFSSFSLAYDGLACDEQDYIRDIQAKYGFDTRFVSAGAFAGRLQSEPPGFLEAPNMGVRELRDALFGAAEATGARTLLTGDLADGCVGGSFLVFDSLLRQGQLGRFWQQLQAYRPRSSEPLRKILALYCLAPLLPGPLQQQLNLAYLRRAIDRDRAFLLPAWMPQPLRDDLVERHLQLSVEEEQRRRFANPSRETEYRLLYPPDVARHPAPWHIELWRPFADRRLHEFLWAVPPETKFRAPPASDEYYAGSKRLVRQAMRGILPESIRTRKSKTIFYGVWESEIERQWPEYEATFGPSGSPEIARRGYVDHAKFWKRLQQLRGVMRGDDAVYAMQLIGLETWLRALTLRRPALVTPAPPWRPSEPNRDVNSRAATLITQSRR